VALVGGSLSELILHCPCLLHHAAGNLRISRAFIDSEKHWLPKLKVVLLKYSAPLSVCPAHRQTNSFIENRDSIEAGILHTHLCHPIFDSNACAGSVPLICMRARPVSPGLATPVKQQYCATVEAVTASAVIIAAAALVTAVAAAAIAAATTASSCCSSSYKISH
jgi:hypothetical protein